MILFSGGKGALPDILVWVGSFCWTTVVQTETCSDSEEQAGL